MKPVVRQYSLLGRARRLVCVSMFFSLPSAIFNPACGQQPWNYASIGEMHLDDAYLLAPPDSLVPLLNKAAGTGIRFDKLYRISVEMKKKDRSIVTFQSDSCTFSLRQPQAEALLPYLVSDRYWRERFRQLQRWTYVNMSAAHPLLADTADHRYGPYCPLSWQSYTYLPHSDRPVQFAVRTNIRREQTLGLDAVQHLAERGAFTTDAGMDAYEQNRRDMAAAEQARRQALERHLDSLDLMGQQAARLTDSIATAIRRDSLALADQLLRQQVEDTKQRMNRDQIFLMSLKTARSDYMFGLEFNFYNCFPKTISKIEISVTPVNERGQVQADQFKRTVRTVRCMGPVHPGSPAQYTFDELFWDEKGRIRYMRVSSITFHFPDGTRRTFNGHERILKHTLSK